MRTRKGIFSRRALSLLLALCLTLGCAGCGGARAASMFLRKAQGAVHVSDAEGKGVEIAEDLGLYSGYGVGTGEESYAWIDLDRVKLAKLSENSEAAITKEGKKLSIELTGGSLFFNVTEPLADDETMELRSSSLLVGIRGTCGWMSQRAVSLLEGTVTVTAGEQSITVSAGEQAVLTEDGALETRELTFESIPAFVARELLDDEALAQAVREASDLAVPTTYAELEEMLGDVVYSEEIDFEADGSPELLVIRDGGPNGRFAFRIYRMGPDGPQYLTGGNPVGITDPTRYACLLAERDGRLFVQCQSDGSTSSATGQRTFMDLYYGSIAEQDGGREDWGVLDYYHMQSLSREPDIYMGAKWVAIPNEKGFVDDMNRTQQVWEDWRDYWEKYTTVRELYATTPGG